MKRLSSGLNALTARQMVLLLSGIFAVVHVAYLGMGIRFDVTPLTHFWQFLDPELLKTRLLESAFYLHMQPPLFNLFLGIVLQLFPAYAVAFQALYVLAGLALYQALFALMRWLGVRRPLALIVSTALLVSPSFILYEHWLFYTFPLAALLVISALLLARLMSSGDNWAAACFFATLFCLCATRSLFQAAYFAFIAVAILVLAPQRRRQILYTATLPFLLLMALYTKNFLVFGHFSTSTWVGMNAWGVIGRNMPEELLSQLVAQGELSPLVLIDRFSPLEDYPAEYRRESGPPTVPVLSQARKSTGTVNYNHKAFIGISDRYLADAIQVVRHQPQYFLIGVAKGWFNYFRSSSDYVFLENNQARISTINGAFDTLVYGKLPFDLGQWEVLPLSNDAPRHIYLFLLLGLPTVVAGGLWLGLGRSHGAPRLNQGQRIVLLFVCFNILYVAGVGNLLEVGENHRFRFMTDPLSLVLMAACIQHLVLPRLRRPSPAAGGTLKRNANTDGVATP